MQGQAAVYNVHDFGASGSKEDSAQAAIQQAIDAAKSVTGKPSMRSGLNFRIER